MFPLLNGAPHNVTLFGKVMCSDVVSGAFAETIPTGLLDGRGEASRRCVKAAKVTVSPKWRRLRRSMHIISNECVDTVALLGCRVLGRKQCVQANNDPGGCLLRVRRIKDDQNLSVIWRG